MSTIACGLLAVPALAAAEPAPLGHTCKAQNGVRFCPTETLAQRVPTFDNVPLDVDVTLPPTGEGPFPTIVMLHGWGNDKTSFESSTPAGDGNETYDYNNIYYAQHGYAVVNYSARGWGNSCGSLASREDPGCKEGWLRLADQRYEARDTQFLLGKLVDEGIAQPGHLGVTGISYGGGQSIELAYLKNRIRLPNGEFVPWTSPNGVPLAISAAYPRWPWSDLVDALLPNGRFLDTEIAPSGQSREPIGVEIQSYVSGLYALGNASGYIAPAGLDPEAELTKWFGLFNAGEPYTFEAEAVANQIYTYHQGYGLSGNPAPMLMESGWTDDLFPPEQSLRVYNAVLANGGQVALQVGDLGHSRGSNKENTDHAFNEQAASFFEARLKETGEPPASGSVTAYTQTCPKSAPGGGPFTASSWAGLHPGTITFGSPGAQIFTSAGGSSTIAAEFDPIGGTTDACKSVKAETETNTANYTMVSKGFTLLGMPTVTATIKTLGPFGELVSRLWDVLPNGEQRLISHGVYRLTENQEGTITFQLHGNGYEFAAGDTVKLQLLGRDAPYYRASNGTFSIEAQNVTVSLPASPPPPTAVTEPASSVTQASATLNATVNPEGATVSDCHFEYGTTMSYGVSVPCSSLPGSGEIPVPVSAAITGLTANATYHFRVCATNPGGSSCGSDETVKTPPSCTAEGFCTSFSHSEFSEPNAVAVDPSGNIWAAGAHDQVLEFNAQREYVRQFGKEGTGEGQFEGIGGLATDASGDVYVTDYGNNRVEEFSATGTYLRQFGSTGLGGGQFYGPTGIALDSTGNVWVLNTHGIRLQKFSAAGDYLSGFGSVGWFSGVSSGLAISGQNLYVSEPLVGRVQEYSSTGTSLALFDERGSGNGKSSLPMGIASDPTTGNLYVTDFGSDRVQEFSSEGGFIAAFGSGGSGAGHFSYPEAVAVGSSGHFFVADTRNNRIEEWLTK